MKLNVTPRDIHLLAAAMMTQADLYTEMADDKAARPEDREMAANLSHDAERLFQRLNALSHGLMALDNLGNLEVARRHLGMMEAAVQTFEELTA